MENQSTVTVIRLKAITFVLLVLLVISNVFQYINYRTMKDAAMAQIQADSTATETVIQGDNVNGGKFGGSPKNYYESSIETDGASVKVRSSAKFGK